MNPNTNGPYTRIRRGLLAALMLGMGLAGACGDAADPRPRAEQVEPRPDRDAPTTAPQRPDLDALKKQALQAVPMAGALEQALGGRVLRIGILFQRPPFAYHDEFGTRLGFEVDLAGKIATIWGVKANIEPLDPGLSLDQVAAGLERGEWDAVFWPGEPDSEPDRRPGAAPYYVATLVRVTLSASGIGGGQVCVDRDAPDRGPDAARTRTDSGINCLTDLIRGRTPAAVIDNSLVILGRNQAPGLSVDPETASRFFYHILTARAEAPLSRAFEQTIEVLVNAGVYAGLYKTWFWSGEIFAPDLEEGGRR